MSLVVKLIGQQSQDVIGRLSVSRMLLAVETVKSDWCVSIPLFC